MFWRNTPVRYGVIAKTLHWMIAVLILLLLPIGLTMSEMDISPQKLELYSLHKAFGITVLMLAALRIIWRLFNIQPERITTHKPWERGLANLTHILLYASMFAMPLSGWIMSSAYGFSVSYFGLFTLPDMVEKNRDLAEFMEEVHETIAYLLMILIGLHIAGALKHHIMDRDGTLRRMLPFASVTRSMLIVALLSLAGTAPALARPPTWTVIPEQSAIRFEAKMEGAVFDGQFRIFNAGIAFDPEDLKNSRVRVEIDISSIDTGNDERDAAALTPDWFHASAFPMAVFEAVDFERQLDNQYIAHGTLTIRDVTRPLDLPFTLDIHGGAGETYAAVEGMIGLNRLDFGVGQGQWSDEGTVATSVFVRFQLKAIRDDASAH